METNTRTTKIFICGHCDGGEVTATFRENSAEVSMYIEKCNKCGGQYYAKGLLSLKKKQPPRRFGRTTRLADECVQELFTTGHTLCLDHHIDDDGHTSKRLLEIVIRRFQSEHGPIEQLTIDYKKFSITLKSFHKEQLI